ncbi:aspartate aminotransferase family protein [Nitrososphaera viennensis]|uniref:Glutamate-1-semialdehyde 2,1-aminomutase n=1 Tax=Nitrososphaera viennensis TaxID=1034015 RepID=A0A977IDT1_9ARCH|nr:glutamate-1-semialdehyde 2,1-aminomutase [Nitrososphaera viennensis]UVS68947.1 glutamate-1-semialdehyde 2,1-aminomutase [Nitrososphaera viennensis]
MVAAASSRSEQLYNRAKKVLPGGVDSPVRYFEPYPFFAASARGSKLVTADHRTLTDYCMGYGAMLLGHGYPSVLDAARSQLDKGTLYCVPTELEIKLAELVSKAVPCADMVRLVNTGSEATMNAIRLARAFTKKKKVIKFDGGYHGAHDYVLVKAGSGAASLPASEGVLEEASAQTIVSPYNDAAELERTIERNRDDAACVIMEPVLANIGLVLPDKNYLSDVRKITQQNDTVLIFDEVVTGFRLALGGAGEFFGIRPDLATFAKALGNGFPVGAIAGSKEIMQQLAPAGRVYQASTFAGNPVSVSAAIAALSTLFEAKDSIYPQVARTCDSIVEGIREELEDIGGINCTINSIGSMYQVFFTADRVRDEASAKKADPAKFRKLFDELLRRNVFIPPSQFETCFVSYAHDEDDVDRTVDAYSEAFKKIKEQQK